MASGHNINSTVHLLRSRELGSNCYIGRKTTQKNSSTFFRRQIQRILIKSRATARKTSSEPKFESLEDLNNLQTPCHAGRKRKTSSSESYNWTRFCPETNVKLSLFMIDTKFLLRVPLPEKTVYKVYCFLPSKSHRLSLQYAFSETEKKQWESFAIWCPADDPAGSKLGTGKMVKTLMTLHKPSSVGLLKTQKICLYDFNNGKLLTEIPLISEKTTYTSMNAYHAEKRVVCTSSKSSRQKDVAGEFLIFSIPPFTFSSHLQIKKCAVEKNVYDTEIIGQFFTMTSKTVIEISNFEQVMTTATRAKDNVNENDLKLPVTDILLNKPVVLWKIDTANGYLALQENVSPPFYFTKKKNLFKAHFQDEITDNDEDLTIGEDNGIIFFPDEECPTTSLKILHGSTATGYQIFALQPAGTTHRLQKIFPKTCSTTETDRNTETYYSGKRNEYHREIRLCKNRKSYVDSSCNAYGIDYNGELELFAVVTALKKIINITLYDSVTMDAYAELQPIKIPSKDRFSNYDCRQLIVDLQSTFLSILFELDTDKKRRIYCLSFTDEPKELV